MRFPLIQTTEFCSVYPTQFLKFDLQNDVFLIPFLV